MQIGYAEATTTQSNITSEVDITSLSVDVTVSTGGYKVRITGFLPRMYGTAGDRVAFRIKEGSTTIQTAYYGVVAEGAALIVEAIITPSAGNHTYKLTMQRDTGSNNVNLYMASDAQGFIHVEELV
ncbi:MAG: hypothetical protein AAB553_00315 [Patescibacteria group bacterium]